MRRLLAALLAVFAAVVAPAIVCQARALAGSVEGSVSLRPADLAIRDNSKPNPYVGQLSASAKSALAASAVDSTYGVAWIADAAPGGGATPGAGATLPPVRMDQLGQRFVPRILAIVAGQTVEFHNSDNVFHNIFSYSPPKKFDLGRYPKGKSRSVTFVKAGAVQVYCDIHSDMRADIIVTPSRSFALIGPSGRFRIADVTPGPHTVKVWLPTGERSETIEVPQQGSALLPMLMP
jgi:plastocyanin